MNQATEQLMEVIVRSPGCLFEELVLECPGLTWNQIFCEFDRMSRTVQVRLTAKGRGVYALTSAITRETRRRLCGGGCFTFDKD